ncbi:hypothetical protein [Clostridium paraputrificum]|uniref:Uncharacterized protein n=1 Tax=Clostridium paraputrificum TaxID=29363 RepID=A0A1B8RT13_9CLOT|nr:hypothetical protein [Clostridium paraputrificum]OBY11920.1 hypothetical protein CP373A1_03070 [Clostridium paraputrificum]
MIDLYINIITTIIVICILFIAFLIILKVFKLLEKYIIRPDYPEIYEYEKRFAKATNEEFEKLREDIFKEFDDASKSEINDLETKINIEIDDLNKGNTIYSTITMITFILGVCINTLDINEWTFKVILLLSYLILIIFFLHSKNSRKYNKYLVFLNELIKRYKDTINYKKLNKE